MLGRKVKPAVGSEGSLAEGRKAVEDDPAPPPRGLSDEAAIGSSSRPLPCDDEGVLSSVDRKKGTLCAAFRAR